MICDLPVQFLLLRFWQHTRFLYWGHLGRYITQVSSGREGCWCWHWAVSCGACRCWRCSRQTRKTRHGASSSPWRGLNIHGIWRYYEKFLIWISLYIFANLTKMQQYEIKFKVHTLQNVSKLWIQIGRDTLSLIKKNLSLIRLKCPLKNMGNVFLKCL